MLSRGHHWQAPGAPNTSRDSQAPVLRGIPWLALLPCVGSPSTFIPHHAHAAGLPPLRVDEGTGERSRGRVLVVDDSIIVQKLLVRALSKLDFEVDTATNGSEALEKMKAGEYVTVLMDFLMPVMDGVSATRLFRAWEEKEQATDQARGGEEVAQDDLMSDKDCASSPRGRKRRQHVIGISGCCQDGPQRDEAIEAGVDHFMDKSSIKVDSVVEYILKLKEGGFLGDVMGHQGQSSSSADAEKRRTVNWDSTVRFRLIPHREELDKNALWWSHEEVEVFKSAESVRRLMKMHGIETLECDETASGDMSDTDVPVEKSDEAGSRGELGVWPRRGSFDLAEAGQQEK
mmetsp:Transcript_28198/g.62943  ORF Transcript_28198/g.62943 Transcript_28198/m.62943 type:complete len:345 (+) Transcript_28198:168-1202(+)|eukprot:CAMPEP_0172617274 /NCGR_PEP_ID=MMETSP1068-20121228/70150_1 /TAXON_ID=35684 /ORGANISM="Pseudopedinella elastica, Strain CCMP716" /LENGTH=344 /DNA_ID=CAMNT_0013423003 /DNA_START=289 /DNA_END=1323 /DNA_ORIENTATION=+